MDRDVQQYCKEIAEDFINEYNKVLDETFFKMFEFFGFKEGMNTADWLEEKNFDLLMDEEYNSSEDKKTKTIFLVDKNENDVVSLFMIETVGGISYRVSDVFVKQLGDF